MNPYPTDDVDDLPDVPLIGDFAEYFEKPPTQTPLQKDAQVLDHFLVALEELRDQALITYTSEDLRAPSAEMREWLAARAGEIVSRINVDGSKAAGRAVFSDYEKVISDLLDALLGLGPLEHLFDIPGIEDIAICGHEQVHYRDASGWHTTPIRFKSAQELEFLLKQNLDDEMGRTISPTYPILESRLRKGGARISLVTRPIAEPWPAAVIRVHRDEGELTVVDLLRKGDKAKSPGRNPHAFDLPDYREYDSGRGILTAALAAFLHMSVLAGLNILVIGETGAGKTVLTQILLRFLPLDRRVIIIEDTPELKVLRRPNTQRFLVRKNSLEGLPPVLQAHLVELALRQRPDALTLTEARGGEIYDLLKLLGTGHRNGITSIHASGVEELYERVTLMLQESPLKTQITPELVGRLVSKAINLVVTLRYDKQEERRWVEGVAEYTGALEGYLPVINPLFAYDHDRRRLMATGYRPCERHRERLTEVGHGYDEILKIAEAGGDLMAR